MGIINKENVPIKINSSTSFFINQKFLIENFQEDTTIEKIQEPDTITSITKLTNNKIAIILNTIVKLYDLSDLKTPLLQIKSNCFKKITSFIQLDNEIYLYTIHSNINIIQVSQIPFYKKIFAKKFSYNTLQTLNTINNDAITAVICLKNRKNFITADKKNIIIWHKNSEKYEILEKYDNSDKILDIFEINYDLFCISCIHVENLNFYSIEKKLLIKKIKKIKFSWKQNCLCLLNIKNKTILFIGGFRYIYLIDIDLLELINKVQLENKNEIINSVCLLKNNTENIIICGNEYYIKEKNETNNGLLQFQFIDEEELIIEKISSLKNLHEDSITSIIFLDNKILTGSLDKNIKILKMK